MTVTTRPPNRNGNRLPRTDGGGRGREIRLGLLGVIGLIVLVVGIPVGLVLGVGYPLPRHAPSKDWLTATITATLIIKILACVVWMVWAHFVVCLLAEWRAVRRGRLPSHVAFGGSSQALARRLVAAVLLLSGAATTFSQLAGPSSSGPAARPHAAVSGQQAGARTTGAGHVEQQPTVARDAHATVSPTPQAAQHAGENKYYVVSPPHGRRYDSLWDIAHRTLGDPLRYKEIFALNQGRVQADGSKLVDANLIRPGWELRLPADAHGPGVHTTHAQAPAQHAKPDTAGAHGDGDARPARTGAHAAPTGGMVDPFATGSGHEQAASSAPGATEGSIGVELLGGALMLAGIVTALTSRRGPYGQASEEEDALAGQADTARANDLDRALRNLAAGRKAQGRALPQPIVAWVSETSVTLTMAAGDLADPPAPWRPGPDSRSWQVELGAVAHAEAAAPYPGLVAVGRMQGSEVFLDLEQAPGPVALAGDPQRARDLAAAVAVQAATCAWSDGARVTLVGFGDADEIARIAPDAIGHVDHLGAVLDDLEAEHRKAAVLRRQLGVDGVLTGRQARRTTAWRPHLLVLSGPPTPIEAARLQNVIGDGRSQFVALAVGDTVGARWRFVLTPDGEIDLGVVGITAAAHRLDREGIARLASLAALAAQDRGRQAASLQNTSPRNIARSMPTEPVRHLAEPRAEITLLGPVTVVAAGPVEDSKRELLTAVIVAVALQPDGAHEQVLRASVWPRGVSDDVFRAVVADAASWLGQDTQGRPALREDNGRWYLGDTVRVDADELRRLAAAAEGDAELESLTRALGLVRGEAFSGSTARSCGWLAFRRAARDARVIGTAVALDAARLHLADGRAADAEQALRTGLTLVPSSEPLWRELLRVVARRGPDAAAQVAGEAYATLERLRVWPEPETDALVAQLAPGYRAPQPSDPAAEAIG